MSAVSFFVHIIRSFLLCSYHPLFPIILLCIYHPLFTDYCGGRALNFALSRNWCVLLCTLILRLADYISSTVSFFCIYHHCIYHLYINNYIVRSFLLCIYYPQIPSLYITSAVSFFVHIIRSFLLCSYHPLFPIILLCIYHPLFTIYAISSALSFFVHIIRSFR